jgi:hypothetical protein
VRTGRRIYEELLKIVEVDFNDYRKEALDFAKDELSRRGVKFQEPGSYREVSTREDSTDEETSDQVEVDTSWAETCARCGGKARPGVLLEDKEITVFLTDRDEQRFLEVYACSQCGHVQLALDFDTEVEGK